MKILNQLFAANESSGWRNWILWWKQIIIWSKQINHLVGEHESPGWHELSGWTYSGFAYPMIGAHHDCRAFCLISPSVYSIVFVGRSVGFCSNMKQETWIERVGDTINGFAAQVRHFEISKIMNIEVSRCLGNGIHHPLIQNRWDLQNRWDYIWGPLL